MSDAAQPHEFEKYYTIKDVAQTLSISLEKARSMVKDEPGVLKFTTRNKSMYRVPGHVIERILRRSSNPVPTKTSATVSMPPPRLGWRRTPSG
jgi:hypothetical protein